MCIALPKELKVVKCTISIVKSLDSRRVGQFVVLHKVGEDDNLVCFWECTARVQSTKYNALTMNLHFKTACLVQYHLVRIERSVNTSSCESTNHPSCTRISTFSSSSQYWNGLTHRSVRSSAR